MWKKVSTITLRTQWIDEKLKTLKEIYNIWTNSKVVEMLIDAELRRQWFNN